LVAYATAIKLSRHYADQIGKHDDAFKRWLEATKTMAMLATRLRLAPQSRLDRKAAGLSQGYEGNKPWNYGTERWDG
jgi:hypothetical protein